jgi:hypothetical protein
LFFHFFVNACPSLSERARNIGVAHLLHRLDAQDPSLRSPIEVLTGDFNAEPHEASLQYLLGGRRGALEALHLDLHQGEDKGKVGDKDKDKVGDNHKEEGKSDERDNVEEENKAEAATDIDADADAAAAVGDVSTGETEEDLQDKVYSERIRIPFQDSWEVGAEGFLKNEPWSSPAEKAQMEQGFTFPACNPVKRIDFILVRNTTASSAGGGSPSIYAEIVSFGIEGTRPSAATGTDHFTCCLFVCCCCYYMVCGIVFLYFIYCVYGTPTEHLVGSREGLGMNDMDSPLWASDHFAVVSDLRIVRKL